MSVHIVQVSGEWAVCGQNLSTAAQSDIELSDSTASVAVTTRTLSSNLRQHPDVADAAGQTQSVSGLQQPIEFDLTAALPPARTT